MMDLVDFRQGTPEDYLVILRISTRQSTKILVLIKHDWVKVLIRSLNAILSQLLISDYSEYSHSYQKTQ